MISQIPNSDIQFNGPTETDGKLRRLMESLRRVERAINDLIANGSSTNTVTVTAHQIADTVGFGPDHYSNGLTPGQVLRAFSSTNARFQALNFDDLARTSIADIPNEGQILQFVTGYWTNVDLPSIGQTEDGINTGGGQGIYSGIIGTHLQFKSLRAGVGITIAPNVDSSELVFTATATATGDGYPAALGYAGIL